jgi:IPT/TIG domain
VNPAPATPNSQAVTTTTSSSQPSLSTNADASTPAPTTSVDESPACTDLKLECLSPDHGPMHGGEKILIVGSGFGVGQGLKIQFGPNPSVQTVLFKAPNILRCILPPSRTAGPTRVTLHWSEGTKTRVSADHCEFTYTDNRDQIMYVNHS